VCRHRGAVDNAVARVPAALRACAIEKHFASEAKAKLKIVEATRTRRLPERDDGKRSRDHPAIGAAHPGPPVFVRIKLNASIRGSKLPFPKPIPLTTSRPQEPRQAFDALWSGFKEGLKSEKDKGGDPRAIAVIADKRRPASIGILGAQQELAYSGDSITFAGGKR
jgi:hypothetical protein